MTPTQIEDAARAQYNAVNDTFFTQAEILRLMYRGCAELASKAQIIERSYTTTSVADQKEYSYPTNTHSIVRVEYNGAPLQKLSLREEDSIRYSNASTVVSGTPRYYSIFDFTLRLTPAPDTAGVTIKVFSYNQPQDISITSTLEIPTLFHDGLIDYILSKMYAKDGNMAASQYHMTLWKEVVQDAVRWKARMKRSNAYAVVGDEESLEVTVLGAI